MREMLLQLFIEVESGGFMVARFLARRRVVNLPEWRPNRCPQMSSLRLSALVHHNGLEQNVELPCYRRRRRLHGKEFGGLAF